jgi:hypothetical protein
MSTLGAILKENLLGQFCRASIRILPNEASGEKFAKKTSKIKNSLASGKKGKKGVYLHTKSPIKKVQ